MSSKLRRGRSIKFPKKHIKGIAGRREGAKKSAKYWKRLQRNGSRVEK